MRVLVVEDAADVAELMRMALELENHVVLSAATGEQALSILEMERVDVVLLDLSLPGIDGLDVLAHLRDGPDALQPKVYVLSAHASGHKAEQARALGADGYLIKPFGLEALLALFDGDARHP